MTIEAVQREAQYWLVRLNSGTFSAEDQSAFELWLAESETHQREYERVALLWDKMGSFESRSFPAREAAHAYRPLQRMRIGIVWHRTKVLRLVVGLGLLVGAVWWTSNPIQVYRTAKGERQSITLADGARVELNTDTVLRVQFSRQERTVYLEQGEALFTVPHNEDSRPFEIIAGGGRIRDLGTSFTVHQRADRVSVVVVDGAVSVSARETSPVKLIAGNRIWYGSSGELSSIEKVDVGQVLAWRTGKLVFDRIPLGEVLEELARYHDVEFFIKDIHIRDLKVSGTFAANELALFLSTLEATFPVATDSLGDRLVAIDRAPPGR